MPGSSSVTEMMERILARQNERGHFQSSQGGDWSTGERGLILGTLSGHGSKEALDWSLNGDAIGEVPFLTKSSLLCDYFVLNGVETIVKVKISATELPFTRHRGYNIVGTFRFVCCPDRYRSDRWNLMVQLTGIDYIRQKSVRFR